MDTLKTKTAKSNQVVFHFIQYFVHPPGVASTARYRLLIDKRVCEYTVVELPHTSDE